MVQHKDTARQLTWMVYALLWGAYLVIMYLTGALARCYQTAPYFYFTGAAGVLLIVLGVKASFSLLRGRAAACQCEACGHDHETPALVRWTWWHSVKHHVVLGLVLMPLLIGVLVPSRGLNALAAMRRGGTSDPRELLNAFRSERRKFVEMEGNYQKLDLLEILERAYADEEVKASTLGFVYWGGDKTPGMLNVARFKMTCCAACAVPISLRVRWPDAERFQNDTWVKILGTARRETIDGHPTVVLTADNIQETTAPSYPYM